MMRRKESDTHGLAQLAWAVREAGMDGGVGGSSGRPPALRKEARWR